MGFVEMKLLGHDGLVIIFGRLFYSYEE